MKHYKDSNNVIHAFELDGSQDSFIKSDMQMLSDSELAILLAPTQAEIKAEKKAKIQTNIDAIERKSLRVLREALLNNDITELVKIESEIEIERVKLLE